jgi:integrase
MAEHTVLRPLHSLTNTTTADADNREQLAVMNFLASHRGSTRVGYEAHLKSFYGWCRMNGITSMLDITRGQLELYLRTLEETVSERTGEPLAQATIANRFGAVANFLEHAANDDLIPKNPAKQVRRPKVDRDAQTRTWFDVGDFHLFVRQAQRSTIQDEALILLMATTGIRVAEVCSLNVSDVHLERGQAYIEYKRKGGKITRPDLPTSTLLAVQRLVDTREGDGPLFVTVRGTRFDRRAVQRVIDRLSAEAGIGNRVTPHGLRRSFGDVQRALYQADPRTTQLYIRIANGGSTARHMVADLLASAG